MSAKCIDPGEVVAQVKAAFMRELKTALSVLPPENAVSDPF